MRKKLVLLMVVLGIEANAQNISGIVMDEKSEPIAFASITLMQANDSSFVAGATTDMDGRFKMDAEPDGKLLKVSYVGYATQILQPAQNMSIVLKEEGVSIGDVVITGNRPAYKMKGGALIVPVENTVLSRFGSATEMLSHLPMMMDDGTVVGRGTNRQKRSFASVILLTISRLAPKNRETSPFAVFPPFPCTYQMKGITLQSEYH